MGKMIFKHLMVRRSVRTLFLILLIIGALFFALNNWPGLGAQGADILRAVLGDQAVARLEMVLFRIQDSAQNLEYQIGLQKPAAPWQSNTLRQSIISKTTSTPTEPPIPIDVTPTPSQPVSTTRTPKNQPAQKSQIINPTPSTWVPKPVSALGTLPDEGIWLPYISNSSGEVVAYRTFLQPDPDRPYAIVGIVAFDLTKTRLHYMLGSIEPASPDGPKRTGMMPAQDLQPGRLLATFNGGFKATHGQFGAMADGIIALPPRDDLGTIAIYSDNSVRIGVWGSEIQQSPELLAWRQNGPLVIQNDKVNPEIFNNSPKDWGYTVNDVSPTWRSALGISKDNHTLFYLAGSKLTMHALSESMIAAGASQGIQLDINNFWVHFVAIRTDGNNLIPEPLFPAAMIDKLDRYLHPYPRDFFYVTTIP
jgi:hypothetical protein